MPAPLQPQPTIAFVWDFEHAVLATALLGPVLTAYDVDPERFAEEVAGLAAFHAVRSETLNPSAARLIHLVDYVQSGAIKGLTNASLKRLGGEPDLAPGIVELMDATRAKVRSVPEFAREGITVEHYAVTTGPVVMVEGSGLGEHLDGAWGSTFLGERAAPGYLDQLPVVAASQQPLSHVGIAYGYPSVVRTLFEISKGVNVDPSVHADDRMADDHRRVPLANMVFVTGDPGWVPGLSVINAAGGKTLGVATPGADEAPMGRLLSEGRVQHVAAADYTNGAGARAWLMEAMEQIAYGIVEHRRQAFAGTPDSPSPPA
jgi:hypothetical protein